MGHCSSLSNYYVMKMNENWLKRRKRRQESIINITLPPTLHCVFCRLWLSSNDSIPTTEILVYISLTHKPEMLTFKQLIYYRSKLVYNRLHYFTLNKNIWLVLYFRKSLSNTSLSISLHCLTINISKNKAAVQQTNWCGLNVIYMPTRNVERQHHTP
jgi:hypothetical protein